MSSSADRQRRCWRSGGIGAGLTLGLVLAGCGGGKPEATAFGRGGEPACAVVSAQWPVTVGGQGRTELRVTGDHPESVAAWGSPAMVARCGAPEPAPSTECLSVDGVDWVPVKLNDGYRFTTFGTSPSVQVLVPSHYAPESLLLPAFTALARTLPKNGHHCS